MTQRLRLQHLVIQPVLILDDGDEILPGLPLQPINLPVSQVQDFLARLPFEVAALQRQMDEAEKGAQSVGADNQPASPNDTELS